MIGRVPAAASEPSFPEVRDFKHTFNRAVYREAIVRFQRDQLSRNTHLSVMRGKLV